MQLLLPSSWSYAATQLQSSQKKKAKLFFETKQPKEEGPKVARRRRTWSEHNMELRHGAVLQQLHSQHGAPQRAVALQQLMLRSVELCCSAAAAQAPQRVATLQQLKLRSM